MDLEAVQDPLLLEYKTEVLTFLLLDFLLQCSHCNVDHRFDFFGMIVAAGLVQSASVLIINR